MAKGKSRKNHRETEGTLASSNNSPYTHQQHQQQQQQQQESRQSLYQWCLQEQQGILWVLGCAFIGSLLGFAFGSGLLTGQWGGPPDPWRVALGMKLRTTAASYRIWPFMKRRGRGNAPLLTDEEFEDYYGDDDDDDAVMVGDVGDNNDDDDAFEEDGIADAVFAPYGYNGQSRAIVTMDTRVLRSNPSHPTVYAVLKEAVMRERGGFVHPDLGFLQPAPSGAYRGLGMVRESWNTCQKKCNPGIASEKLKQMQHNGTDRVKVKDRYFRQEEVLLKVPLKFQMTRSVALDTLLPRIPGEVQNKLSTLELDDAALLVLLLAHERGVGRFSRWLPYIASLPLEPSCGYSKSLRPYLLDSLQALRDEMGLDVNGWSGELIKATNYAERIAVTLARDYGNYIKHPKGTSAVENIQWSLCQVASRAIAGSQEHGALRLIPLADIINHDANAGSFVELTGTERLEEGDFVEAVENDSGAFVVRSLRHGNHKALRVGQELLVNYNVPHFSALDWFISMGFVPPERLSKNWQKMDAALPRVRRDGPFGNLGISGRQSRTTSGSSGGANIPSSRTPEL